MSNLVTNLQRSIALMVLIEYSGLVPKLIRQQTEMSIPAILVMVLFFLLFAFPKNIFLGLVSGACALILNLAYGWTGKVTEFSTHHLFIQSLNVVGGATLLLFLKYSAAAPAKKDSIFINYLKSLFFLIYGYAIISKLNLDYISGYRLVQNILNTYGSTLDSMFSFFIEHSQALSLGAIIIEVLLLVSILTEKCLTLCFWSLMFFHILIYFIFPTGCFSLYMIFLFMTYQKALQKKDSHEHPI